MIERRKRWVLPDMQIVTILVIIFLVLGIIYFARRV